MADEKKRLCPSCGYKMLGGKYCPECKAELVDEETARPAPSDAEERIAQRTAAIVLENLRKGREETNEETGTAAKGKGGGSIFKK